MLAESAPWTFCQNNTVMLTYTHNHAHEILLWRCSCNRNEKQNSKSFCNYDANLTIVITMELKLIFFLSMSVSLYDVISCDGGTCFKFWLRLWLLVLSGNFNFERQLSVMSGYPQYQCYKRWVVIARYKW